VQWEHENGKEKTYYILKKKKRSKARRYLTILLKTFKYSIKFSSFAPCKAEILEYLVSGREDLSTAKGLRMHTEEKGINLYINIYVYIM